MKKSSNKQNENMRLYYILILLLAIVGLIFSIVIQAEKSSVDNSGFCDIVNPGGCDTVQNSRYGRFLGIDNPYYGIVGFSLLMILSAFQLRKEWDITKFFIIAGCIIAGAAAIYMLYLQAFVIGTWCIYCIIVDISSILLLALGVYLIIRWR